MFTCEELIDPRIRARIKLERRLRIVSVLITAGMAVFMVLLGVMLTATKAWFVGSCLLAGFFLFWTALRQYEWRAQPWRVALTLIPVVMLTWLTMQFSDSAWVTAVTASAVVLSVGMTVSWFVPRWGRWLVITSAATPVARGVAITGEAIHRKAAGFRWTDYDWAPRLPNGREFPISVEDALWLGPLHITVAGVVAGACWFAAAIRERQLREMQP